MAQVTVTVNGRRYEVTCDDGQESHLFRLAEDVDQRVARLVASVGKVNDARLLLLTSLLLADELQEIRAALANGDHEGRTERRDGAASGGAVDEAALATDLDRLADRIEAVARRLADRPLPPGEPSGE